MTNAVPGRLVALVLLALGGCGNDGGTVAEPDAAEQATYRPPTLTAFQPPAVSVGGGAFVLAAEGVFDPDAIVLFEGAPLTTRVTSATTLEADVPATAIEVPGTRSIQIVHTGSGGGLSVAEQLVVIDGIAGPVLDVLVPDQLIAGTAAAPIEVIGWNFRDTSVVMWNGTARPTTFLGSSRLRAQIPATDFAIVGTADVTVVTPDAVMAESPLVFTIQPQPVETIGVSALVSITSANGTASGFGGALSLDGRFVAFESVSSTIVAGDTNGAQDIFVRDTCRGAAGCTPSTLRVSVDTAGGQANGGSNSPAISATGRYVAFISSATNLVAGAGNGVYVRDTCLGASACTPSTMLASILPSDGSITAFGAFRRLAISRTGRFVAFENTVAVIRSQVFLTDTCLGVAAPCTPASRFASRTLDTATPSFAAEWPSLSADGRYLAFQAIGSLDGQPATALRRHVWVLDTCFGATSCTEAITRASIAVDGSEANGFPIDVAISDDGRYVGFATFGSTWTTDANPNDHSQVIVRDTCLGASNCTPSNTSISAVAGVASNQRAFGPRFSADNRYIVFLSLASNLVVNDTNNRYDVFVRDQCLGAIGCTPSVRRVSVAAKGAQGNGDSGGGVIPDEPSPWISGDGEITAWASKATNFIENDGNATSDVFVANTGFGP